MTTHFVHACTFAFFAMLMGLQPINGARAQEGALQIEWHPDPCQVVATAIKAEAGITKHVKFRGHALSTRTLFYAVCEQVRGEIVGRVKAHVEKMRSGLEGELLSRAEPVYDDFLGWLTDFVWGSLPESERNRVGKEEYLRRWLNDPNAEFERFVNYYMQVHAPKVAGLLERLANDSSAEILDGLQELWKGAEEKLSKLGQAEEELRKAPKASKVEEILDKYGIKGPWVEKLRKLESQIRLIDKTYSIADTAKILNDAMTADTYPEKLKGAFTLLDKLGGALSSSRVPPVGLVGDLVQAMAELAKEAVDRAKEVEKLVRMREGMCIGADTHTLLNPQNLAFAKVAPEGTQACPVDLEDEFLKDVFVQTEPADANQLYFWTGKRMIVGRADGGGLAGVQTARDFMAEVASIGYTAYAGKENKIRAVAAVYNTVYGAEDNLENVPGLSVPRTGLLGLRAEADAVVEAIVKRVRDLKDFSEPDQFCSEAGFKDALEKETGLRADLMPLDAEVEQDQQQRNKIKLSYVLGFILLKRGDLPEGGARTGAYSTYTGIWKKLSDLSLVVLEGTVVRTGMAGSLCPECADAPVSIKVVNGEEFSLCRVTRAGDSGTFKARLFTRSPDVSASFTARIGALESEAVTVGRKQLDPPESGEHFMRRFAFNLGVAADAAEPDWSAELELLRGLHAQAQGQSEVSREGCADAAAALAEIKAITEEREALLQAALKRLGEARALPSGDLGASAQRSAEALAAAKAAAERAGQMKKDAEGAALKACDGASKLRSANATLDNAARQTLLNTVETDARAATKAAGEAAVARRAAATALETATAIAQAAEKLRQPLIELAAARQKISALTERLTAVQERLKRARAKAEGAAGKLSGIATRAKGVHGDILGKTSRSSHPDAASAAATASELFGAITAWAATAQACLASLTQPTTESGASQQAVARPGEVLAAIDAILADKDPAQLVGDLRTATESTKAYVDVAELMEEAARAAAGNAETCRQLAETAMTAGASDDLVTAADAAIGLCEFLKAKSAIDAMPAGPQRDAIAERYQSAVSRERAVRGLFEEARALHAAGDTAAALAKLAAARSQTFCDKYRIIIDETAARLRSGLKDDRVSAVRAAVGNCQFAEAESLIEALAAENIPQLANLRAELQSATGREQSANGLWQQANAMLSSGRAKDALSLLRQAKNTTRCKDLISRIDAAIARISAQAVQPGAGESDVSGWQTPWRGTLKTQRIVVNGSPAELTTLFGMMDRDWAAEKQRDAGNDGTASGIFKGLKAEVGDVAIGVVKMLAGVMNDGIGWGFELRPEGGGLRLAVVGADNAAVEINKSLAALPVFIADGERQLSMTHRAATNGATARATIVADEQWTKARLTTVISSAPGTGDEAAQRLIQSVEFTFAGDFEPGTLKAAEIQSELAEKMETARRLYLPNTKPAR